MNHIFKKLSHHALALGLVATLGACAQAPVPEDHYYRLNLTNGSNPGVKLDGIVEVERFIADGLLDSRPILFTHAAQASEIQAYHYHFWAQPPSIMLQNAVTASLQRSNAAKSIVTPNLRIEPDFILAGKIFRFTQILGPQNSVVISLELSLKSAKLDQLIHLNTYSVEIPSTNASVPAAVAAFSLAVDKVISAFLTDLPAKL